MRRSLTAAAITLGLTLAVPSAPASARATWTYHTTVTKTCPGFVGTYYITGWFKADTVNGYRLPYRGDFTAQYTTNTAVSRLLVQQWINGAAYDSVSVTPSTIQGHAVLDGPGWVSGYSTFLRVVIYSPSGARCITDIPAV